MALSLQQFKTEYDSFVEIPVQWGDMDAFAHVNNVVYLRWFESARVHFMVKTGFMASADVGHIGPILASSSIRYKVPIEYPDTVTVGVRATTFDSSEVIQEYGVYSHLKGLVTTAGQSRVVMFDFQTQKKTSVPDELLGRIAALKSTQA